MTRMNHKTEDLTTWIVVADRAGARVLAQANGGESMSEVACLAHPESSMKQSDFVSEHQGRSIGHSGASVAFESKTDWEHKNAILFAKQVAVYLEAGRNSHQFDRLVLIAAPAFLGALRSTLSAPLTKMVDLEVSKDYTACSLKEISAHMTKLNVRT